MREWIRKHKGKIFGAIALAVIAAVCIIRMLQPVKVWDFGEEQLELVGEAVHFDANVINENVPGWYVDNSLEYGDVFAQTPILDLPAGSYQVTIRYQCEGSGSEYAFSSKVDTYRVLLGRNGKPLESGRVKKTLDAYYLQPVEGFQVKIRYGGEGYLILNGIEIRQTRALERCILFLTAAGAGLWVVMAMTHGRTELRRRLLCGAGIAAAATLPVMMPYLYDSYDLPFHLLRIEGIAEGLRDGQFPVRIQPQWMNGYGYPVSVFYGDGILAIAGILRWIGFPLQLSYKIYILVINFLTFLIAVYCLKRIVKSEKIALTGGVLYTFAPYRLMNLYVRDAVGEFTAQTFLLLIFVGEWEILIAEKEERKRSWLLLTAGMTGIIQCHILSCEIVVIMLGITCLVCWKRTFTKTCLADFSKAVAATAAINLFFLLPFLDYMMREEWKVNSQAYGGPIQTAGAFLSQVFAVFPNGNLGNFSIVEGLTEGRDRTFAIGIVFVLGLVLFLKDWRTSKEGGRLWRLGRYCSVSGLILLFMSTIYFPWDFLYEISDVLAVLSSRLQFPWRVLGAAVAVFTVLNCIVLDRWSEKKRQYAVILGLVMVGMTVISTGYFYESVSAEKDYVYMADAETEGTFKLGNEEYLPASLDADKDNFPEGKIWADDGVQIVSREKNGTHYELSCTNMSDQEQTVELPMTYYRGYEARDKQTGGQILIGSGENCRVRLTLAGNYSGTIQVEYREPVLWRVAEMISLISVVGIACSLFRERRNQREYRRSMTGNEI